MVRVGRDLKDHPVPTPLPWAGTWCIRPRVKRMACAQSEGCCCQVVLHRSKTVKCVFYVKTMLARPQHRCLLGGRPSTLTTRGILFHVSPTINQAFSSCPFLTRKINEQQVLLFFCGMAVLSFQGRCMAVPLSHCHIPTLFCMSSKAS